MQTAERTRTRPRPRAARSCDFRVVDSPEGGFYFAMRDGVLLATGWLALGPLPDVLDDAPESPRLCPDLASRLEDALLGEQVDFRDVALPPAPNFAAACRRAAQRIPAGQTRTYAALAKAAGNAAAARAAGQAMRRNPTPVVVPCHRVVCASGVGGFAGTTDMCSLALAVKLALLERESRASSRTG